MLSLLAAIGYGVAYLLDHLTDWLVFLLKGFGLFLGRMLDGSTDGLTLAARKTMLSPKQKSAPIPVGTRFTFAVGRFFDWCAGLLNKTVRRNNPIQTSFVSVFAAGREEAITQFRQLTRSISFGLLMFCLGLYVTLAYLLF